MALQRWKLTIEYIGTKYAGWQRQEDGIKSIQQDIEEALYKFCGQDCRLYVAGRTDAGVHAHGQVAHFDLDYGDRPLTGYTLTKAMNAHLGTHSNDRSICILNAEPVHQEFHARYGATHKLYTYRILSRLAPPTFDQNLVWWTRREFHIANMREAAIHLLGQHDFTSFRATECQAKSPIKTLDRLDIEEISLPDGGQELRFYVEARSFLHHQVRNMVGSLAQVGTGKWSPTDLKKALEAKDRKRGGITAPASGLSLTRVYY